MELGLGSLCHTPVLGNCGFDASPIPSQAVSNPCPLDEKILSPSPEIKTNSSLCVTIFFEFSVTTLKLD